MGLTAPSRRGPCPALLLGLMLLAACGRGEQAAARTPSAEDLGQAREVASRFFAAAEAGNCDVVRELQGEPMTAEACADMVDEWNDHEIALLSILEANGDSRDPDAVIVKARITQEREERTMLVRVEKRDGKWFVTL